MLKTVVTRMIICVVLLTSMVTMAETNAQDRTSVQFLENSNVVRWARGTYEYLEIKTGKWRGEDQWVLTVNSDDTRTMRMLSLVQETGVMRDVVSRVNESFQPLEMFTTTYKDGVRTGTALFLIDDGKARALVNSPQGILTQEVSVPESFALVPHSMATDGWYFPHYDRDKGGTQQITLFNPHGWGNTNGSVLARVQAASARYVGKETLEVPAGSFDTDKWIISNNNDDYEIWVYGPDYIMVRVIDVERNWVYNLRTFEASH